MSDSDDNGVVRRNADDDLVTHTSAYINQYIENLHKEKGRLTIDEFRAKHAAQLEELGGDKMEKDMKAYREQLDKERELKVLIELENVFTIQCLMFIILIICCLIF